MRLNFFIVILLGISIINAKLIMIIRHGEKLNDQLTNLSEKGQARADCLADAFGSKGPFATPQKIFAQNPNEKKQSTRPRDTLLPLARSLGLSIDLSYSEDQYKSLLKAIVDAPEEVILISWSNDNIQDMAGEFGILDAPKWKAPVFDEIWMIKDGRTPQFKNGARVSPSSSYAGTDKWTMDIVKQNVEQCIERIIDAINYPNGHPIPPSNSNSNNNNKAGGSSNGASNVSGSNNVPPPMVSYSAQAPINQGTVTSNIPNQSIPTAQNQNGQVVTSPSAVQSGTIDGSTDIDDDYFMNSGNSNLLKSSIMLIIGFAVAVVLIIL